MDARVKDKNSDYSLSQIISTLAGSDMIGVLSNIASIGASLEANADIYTPEEAGSLVRIQSTRIAELLESLMIVDQIKQGQLALNSSPVALKPYLEESVQSLEELSKKYATRLRLGRTKKLRPVVADKRILTPIINSALDGVIRTTISRAVKIETLTHEDKLFVHITDKDASFESPDDGVSRAQAGSSHAIAIPAFYVATSMLDAIGGELRITANKNLRHIDLVFPHFVQLKMELS